MSPRSGPELGESVQCPRHHLERCRGAVAFQRGAVMDGVPDAHRGTGLRLRRRLTLLLRDRVDPCVQRREQPLVGLDGLDPLRLDVEHPPHRAGGEPFEERDRRVHIEIVAVRCVHVVAQPNPGVVSLDLEAGPLQEGRPAPRTPGLARPRRRAACATAAARSAPPQGRRPGRRTPSARRGTAQGWIRVPSRPAGCGACRGTGSLRIGPSRPRTRARPERRPFLGEHGLSRDFMGAQGIAAVPVRFRLLISFALSST